MSKNHTITVSDEVEAALQQKSLKDGITVIELLNRQVLYYLACALYDDLDQNDPINTPRLSIVQRLEVIAVATTQGNKKARLKVIEILNL